MSTIHTDLFRLFFFFNDTATTEIYTLSLHDALPISAGPRAVRGRAGGHRHAQRQGARGRGQPRRAAAPRHVCARRSEEHTSELQSPCNLVCRLLLEKKTYERCRPFLVVKARTFNIAA